MPVTFVATRGDSFAELRRIAQEVCADAAVIGPWAKAGHRLVGLPAAGSFGLASGRSLSCPDYWKADLVSPQDHFPRRGRSAWSIISATSFFVGSRASSSVRLMMSA